MNKIPALTELYREIEGCRQCGLSEQRNKVVPGEGSENAKILFIGEAPGWHENQQGRPFVGPAGQFLEQLLASIGLKRQEVYICNVVKCRPPGNRDPLPAEIDACRQFLDRQIEVIQPKIIVTLGRYSMARYFPNQTISKIHGTLVRRDGVICFAMYHPAAALHQQSLRRIIEEDVKRIPALLIETEEIQKKEVKPEQLSMF